MTLERHLLPQKAHGKICETIVGGQKVYLRTREYEDGTLGEIFIDLHKESAALRSMMNCFAISISLGLQHGVPLEQYVNTFMFTRFEQQGPVRNDPNIQYATSVIDYVFRRLGADYLKRTDVLHVKLQTPLNSLDKLTEKLDEKSSLTRHAEELIGDTPFCPTCSNITKRVENVYRCLNCGTKVDTL